MKLRFPSPLKGRLTTAIAATAIAISSLAATPVAAADRDVTRAIVGLGALAIIGTALVHENRQKEQVSRHYQPAPQPPRYDDRYDGRHDGRHDNRWDNDRHRPRQDPPRHRPAVVKSVPGHCIVDTRVNGYRAIGYNASCAQHYASQPDWLPQSCLQRTDGRGGPRMIYRRVCMEQQGWRTA